MIWLLQIRRKLVRWMAICSAILLGFAVAAPVQAAVCGRAANPGAAPAGWESYCWLDFTTYNDSTARSTSGQNFSFDLDDGSRLTFNMRVTSTASTGLIAQTAPSWTGAAVGNSSFLNIPGRPILYTRNDGSRVTAVLRNITITPPPGVASINDFAFVVADGESTDNDEYLNYTTNGGAWELLDSVAPQSGNRFPVLTGIGTSTMRSAGGGQGSPIGAHIAGTNRPSQVTVVLEASGLQGVMLAVRFASIKVDKIIQGARIDPSDQFSFAIRSTSSGTVLASGTTSGSGGGPFTAALVATASGITVTLTEAMAAGSASPLSRYRGSLTCTNKSTSSPTPLPNGVVTSSYAMAPLAYGDEITCRFTNAAYPQVSLTKALGAGGRIFVTDQFNLRIRQGNNVVASTTTSGTGTTVTGGVIPLTQLVGGEVHRLDELAVGTTNLARYSPSLACINAYTGSPTVLPTSVNAAFTPGFGDVIRCTLTNSRDGIRGILEVVKTSQLISDPVNGTVNPKQIPGALIRYRVTVRNVGDGTVDSGSIEIKDQLPDGIIYHNGVPATFTNGATPSGLGTFNSASRVRFSNQASGLDPYTYTPIAVPDPAIRGVRVTTLGTMAASDGTAIPEFSVTFDTLVQ